MDDQFDGLARAAATMPRRRALKLLAGTLGAAMLGLGPRGAGAAAGVCDSQTCAQHCRQQYPGASGHCVVNSRGQKTCQCLR